MIADMEFSSEDTVLVRCLITSINGDYYKGRDYQGNNYYIAKNNASKGFQIGDDRSFYAYKKDGQSFFDKKVILYPLSNEEYLKLFGSNGNRGKTLRELGMNLMDI